MRLQLDTVSAGGIDSGDRVSGASAGGLAGTSSRSGAGVVSDWRDSSSISGTSSILNVLAADRSARIQQLSGAVQSGSYQVSSALVSQALVSQAIA